MSDREHAIETIAATARAHRPRPPRWLWMAAGAVSVVCAIGFAILVLRDAPADLEAPTIAAPRSGGGFGIGLTIGGVVGLVIGWTVARAQRRDHSSRNSP